MSLKLNNISFNTFLLILNECLKAEEEDTTGIYNNDYKQGRIEMCQDLINAIKELV